MDARIRNLLWILVASVGLSLALLAVGWWFDENARLDNELVTLQKRARSEASTSVSGLTEGRAALESRLRPLQTLPTPVAFAALVRESLRRSGLELEDFALQEEAGKGGHVRVQMTGSMAQWFAFQLDLEHRAGPILYRSATFDADRGAFRISAVVAYAARP